MPDIATTDVPWLPLALGELGTHEGAGPLDNPRVLAYYRDAGRPDVEHDEVSWCAAFVGAMLHRSGRPQLPHDAALLARSYCRYGIPCEPRPGAIAIWPRGQSGWQGHVGIVLGVDAGRGMVWRISGNEGDQVAIDEAPIATALAFRWPPI